MDRDELAAWLRLELTPGVGNTTARQLLTAFGEPQRVFDASALAIEQVVGSKVRSALQQEPEPLASLLETTWQWLQSNPQQHRVLTLGDPGYPQTLLNMEDPPMLLYGLGPAQFWSGDALNRVTPRAIAVVGSRNPTPQGAINARQFAQALARVGVTIVSGLALGVDAAAHDGALEGAPDGQLATIAVVGTGLDRVYPRQHRDLSHRIAQRGVLLSEYPLGTPPMSANFPKRNRIIAGLGCATLVVEAALQSGSLITARQASEQGKDVFAIPGSIHSTQAKGCHALIKQGAKLVESAQDILEELGAAVGPPPDPSGAQPEGLPASGDGNDLLEAMGFGPMGLDALQARTGLDTATLQAQLMELELLGQLARMPGGLFQRLVRI
jgi:DNA processing protein